MTDLLLFLAPFLIAGFAIGYRIGYDRYEKKYSYRKHERSRLELDAALNQFLCFLHTHADVKLMVKHSTPNGEGRFWYPDHTGRRKLVQDYLSPDDKTTITAIITEEPPYENNVP